eukprot:gnl/TRDRNA2_/TRDRNA2_91226_c0_seq1.p1 gnl/TRDRNA2_/TRDRNA2_91226_c0~~gnl/TRDRNA2_/TRDRNA2_91226_c0_seq1.p1  ORF type:complete len:678 (-),score=136.37 gnl/TRDRNA2_/TRDRNA2_91226_c0_seq1:119-2152(-)
MARALRRLAAFTVVGIAVLRAEDSTLVELSTRLKSDLRSRLEVFTAVIDAEARQRSADWLQVQDEVDRALVNLDLDAEESFQGPPSQKELTFVEEFAAVADATRKHAKPAPELATGPKSLSQSGEGGTGELGSGDVAHMVPQQWLTRVVGRSPLEKQEEKKEEQKHQDVSEDTNAHEAHNFLHDHKRHTDEHKQAASKTKSTTPETEEKQSDASQSKAVDARGGTAEDGMTDIMKQLEELYPEKEFAETAADLFADAVLGHEAHTSATPATHEPASEPAKKKEDLEDMGEFTQPISTSPPPKSHEASHAAQSDSKAEAKISSEEDLFSLRHPHRKPHKKKHASHGASEAEAVVDSLGQNAASEAQSALGSGEDLYSLRHPPAKSHKTRHASHGTSEAESVADSLGQHVDSEAPTAMGAAEDPSTPPPPPPPTSSIPGPHLQTPTVESHKARHNTHSNGEPPTAKDLTESHEPEEVSSKSQTAQESTEDLHSLRLPPAESHEVRHTSHSESDGQTAVDSTDDLYSLRHPPAAHHKARHASHSHAEAQTAKDSTEDLHSLRHPHKASHASHRKSETQTSNIGESHKEDAGGAVGSDISEKQASQVITPVSKEATGATALKARRQGRTAVSTAPTNTETAVQTPAAVTTPPELSLATEDIQMPKAAAVKTKTKKAAQGSS